MMILLLVGCSGTNNNNNGINNEPIPILATSQFMIVGDHGMISKLDEFNNYQNLLFSTNYAMLKAVTTDSSGKFIAVGKDKEVLLKDGIIMSLIDGGNWILESVIDKVKLRRVATVNGSKKTVVVGNSSNISNIESGIIISSEQWY